MIYLVIYLVRSNACVLLLIFFEVIFDFVDGKFTYYLILLSQILLITLNF